MDVASMRRDAPWEKLGRIDWGAAAAWLFGFGVVVYLGLAGGGYDPLVHNQIGVAIWWILLAGVLVGALPRRRMGSLAWVALGLLAAFTVWTALSLVWTESVDRTWADLARIATYLGIFGLALFLRGPAVARLIVGAVGAGIVVVAIVGLLSRLQPAWFTEATQTARFLDDSRERLAYPLNYWNALAALIAIGFPLLLQVAGCAKSIVLRSLAAAALPALALTVFFTLSRGGIGAAVLSIAVFLAFTSDRLPKALTVLVVAAGSAIVIVVASSQDALRHGAASAVAESQGDRLLLILLGVCLVVGLVQAGISIGLKRGLRPRWTYMSSRQAGATVAIALLVVSVAAIARDVPALGVDAWHEFKQGDVPQGRGRLASVGGEGRYEFWAAAVDENATRPLTGTGSGTFEYWWNRNGGGENVRDTHSLYFQTLGELGVVGIGLLAGFLLVVLVGGGVVAIRASVSDRPQLAAALAGCVAFCFTAAFDWMWQMPVLAVVFLLLASILVDADIKSRSAIAWRWPPRAAFAVAAIGAIGAIAVPLATLDLLRQSESDARAGDVAGALRAAESAQDVMPGAATPRLQQALLLEERRDFTGAAQMARAAIEREATNWRPWLVLSRIEAERGRAPAAIRAYRQARSLNPHFSLFQ